MIKSNELRIGNLVYDENGVDGVLEAIYYDEIGFKNSKGWKMGKLHLFNPIPITEEWLLEFGFKSMGNFYRFGYRYQLGYNLHNKRIHFFRDQAIAITKKIDYIHQLQNIYFALTGEELTIKE